jgi:hypothetical protein
VSNLWLNPALRSGQAAQLSDHRELPEPQGFAARAVTGASMDRSSTPVSGRAHIQRTGRQRSGRERTRRSAHPTATTRSAQRLWLRLAAALLLMGSAAFSYLAWSEASLPREEQGTRPMSAAALEREPLASARARVLTLREENTALHQRIAALESRLHAD